MMLFLALESARISESDNRSRILAPSLQRIHYLIQLGEGLNVCKVPTTVSDPEFMPQ